MWGTQESRFRKKAARGNSAYPRTCVSARFLRVTPADAHDTGRFHIQNPPVFLSVVSDRICGRVLLCSSCAACRKVQDSFLPSDCKWVIISPMNCFQEIELAFKPLKEQAETALAQASKCAHRGDPMRFRAAEKDQSGPDGRSCGDCGTTAINCGGRNDP